MQCAWGKFWFASKNDNAFPFTNADAFACAPAGAPNIGEVRFRFAQSFGRNSLLATKLVGKPSLKSFADAHASIHLKDW